MTKTTIRGYAVALSLLGFSTAWTAASRSPWPTTTASNTTTPAAAVKPATAKPAVDPRVIALNRREARLRKRAAQVRQTLATRRAQAVARATVVRVVQSAPVTVTRTS
jgi:hypothetical protein